MQFKPLHLKTTVTEEKAQDCDKVIDCQGLSFYKLTPAMKALG